ncbi:MAG TPA: pyrroloquinoline quinone biosynthesis peptide chaperone PqqD [Candidatus Binatia bacterium]|nr:pyrroloquinoline quinone biosynthesis peptide chaperone PqqD [Candidatus Binatia bacterium]
MDASQRPRFGKGVKLRHDPGGAAMLLVPEGALELNAPAAAALELVDGERTLAQIVEAVVERFEVAPAQAQREIDELFDRLAERGFLR